MRDANRGWAHPRHNGGTRKPQLSESSAYVLNRLKPSADATLDVRRPHRLCEMDQISIRIPNDKILTSPWLFFQPLVHRNTHVLILRIQYLHVSDRNARGEQIGVRFSIEDRRVNVPQIETSAVPLNERIKDRFPILEADRKAELLDEKPTSCFHVGHKQLRMRAE